MDTKPLPPRRVRLTAIWSQSPSPEIQTAQRGGNVYFCIMAYHFTFGVPEWSLPYTHTAFQTHSHPFPSIPIPSAQSLEYRYSTPFRAST